MVENKTKNIHGLDFQKLYSDITKLIIKIVYNICLLKT